jgi:hypothetical protein
MPENVIALHRWLRAWPLALRLLWLTRLLLALGFLPTGLVKLLGHRFTAISVETPVGFFFEAMYQTGFYWRFIGAAQMLAALLLLWPRTALLGALLFAPIVVNIHVITSSVGFVVTPVVTGLMVLAGAYLLAWDAHRLAPLLPGAPGVWAVPSSRVPIGRAEGVCYALAFGAGLVMMLGTRGLGQGPWLLPAAGLSVLAGVAGLLLWVRAAQAARAQRAML